MLHVKVRTHTHCWIDATLALAYNMCMEGGRSVFTLDHRILTQLWWNLLCQIPFELAKSFDSMISQNKQAMIDSVCQSRHTKKQIYDSHATARHIFMANILKRITILLGRSPINLCLKNGWILILSTQVIQKNVVCFEWSLPQPIGTQYPHGWGSCHHIPCRQFCSQSFSLFIPVFWLDASLNKDRCSTSTTIDMTYMIINIYIYIPRRRIFSLTV